MTVLPRRLDADVKMVCRRTQPAAVALSERGVDGGVADYLRGLGLKYRDCRAYGHEKTGGWSGTTAFDKHRVHGARNEERYGR